MKKIIMAAMALMIAIALTVTAAADGYDLRTVSGITAEEIKPYMHPECRHLAEEVIRICEEEEISAEFIVTVMRWERRPDLHNYFGWTNNRGRLMRFSTDKECLEKVIPKIKELYLTEGGRYFKGYTVDAVSYYYNNSDFWRKTITAGMEMILNKEGKR